MGEKESSVRVSDELKRGLQGVWNAIGYDCEQAMSETGDALTNEIAVECCIDANRLQTFGYPDAEKELDELIEAHGYADVYGLLCREVSLA